MGYRIRRPGPNLPSEPLVILWIRVSDYGQVDAWRTDVVEYCGILAHHGMRMGAVRLVELLVDPSTGFQGAWA